MKSREERLKSMRTSKTRKIVRKLNSKTKKGKISREVRVNFRKIKEEKSVASRQRVLNIESDWIHDREAQFGVFAEEDASDEEDNLPLDMLDPEADDQDWQKALSTKLLEEDSSKRRRKSGRSAKQPADNVELKRRRFLNDEHNDDDSSRQQLLPIKLADGRVLRPTMQIPQGGHEDDDGRGEEEREEEDASMCGTESVGDSETYNHEDYSHLSATELISKRKELQRDVRTTIATHAGMIFTAPEDNIERLADLLAYCRGERVHPLVRESTQKLALASTLQILIDVIPGYSIRPLTDEERSQKRTKETRRLQTFEEALLRYYLNYLQLCEKNSSRIVNGNTPVESFTYKLGILSVKALSRLLTVAPHFNYSTNIVSAMVHLGLAKAESVAREACDALSAFLANDTQLRLTAFAARSVSSLATRRARITPALIAVFLKANIREVQQDEKKKTPKAPNRGKGAAQKTNKTARKYNKQLKALKADLREIDEQNAVETKLQHATDALKHIFHVYCLILRRLSDADKKAPALLSPVLDGVAKFAHLLNVELCTDLVEKLRKTLLSSKLSLLDRFRCLETAQTVLSGEGQLLNIDACNFYRSAYRLLPSIAFESSPGKCLEVAVRALEPMLGRRANVPVRRVASFVKRLLLIANVFDDTSSACILALVRRLFVAYPPLSSLVDHDDDADEGGRLPLAGPALTSLTANPDDPDVGEPGDVVAELTSLRLRSGCAGLLADNLLHGVPSTGPFRLDARLASCEPSDLLRSNESQARWLASVKQIAKKRNAQFTPDTLPTRIQEWLVSKRS